MNNEFETLIEYNNYEITHHPFIIRNRITKEVVEQVINEDGFVVVKLDNTIDYLNRIVSIQFNSGRRKYNRRKYEYIDSLSDDVIEITNYNNHTFDKYYYEPSLNQILMRFRGKYKVVQPNYNGSVCNISLTDVNNKSITVSFFKLVSELKQLIRNGEL